MGLPAFDIFSKCLPKGGKSLTMATPVRVELDKPEGLRVVERAGVGVVEVDHHRIRIQGHRWLCCITMGGERIRLDGRTSPQNLAHSQ